MKRNRTHEHHELVKAIRLGLGREKDLTLWPNETAKVLIVTPQGQRKVAKGEPLTPISLGGDVRWIRFGLCEGSSDIVGVLECQHFMYLGMPLGRFIALEVKTPAKTKTARGGRLTAKQMMFLHLIRERGGFAAVVRSVEDARAAIERARKGESECKRYKGTEDRTNGSIRLLL